MTPKELRRQLRDQKKQLKAAMKESSKRAKAKLDANPVVQRERRKRLIRNAAGLTLLLLVLLFLRCDCQPPPPELPATADAGVDAGTKEVTKAPVVPEKKKLPKLQGTVDTQPRGKFGTDATATPSWLDDFRMQVAARSPRLAECFTGSERPGALRWSAAVNATSGAVSDHALEPVGPGPSVQDKQRECLLNALSNPRYKLTPPKDEELPRRVSIVIEF